MPEADAWPLPIRLRRRSGSHTAHSYVYARPHVLPGTYPRRQTFDAARLFAKTEGIIPAPESAHAIAATIREAKEAKEEGKARTILFNLSGHGLIDMAAYDLYLAGDLTNYELPDEELKKSTQDLEQII